MAGKLVAHKIELHLDEQGGSAFTKVAQVYKIEDPSETREPIEMTCLDADIEQNWPGPIIKVGQLKLSLYWCPTLTDHTRLRTLMRTPQPNYPEFPAWEIRLTQAGAKTTMKGWITEIGSTTYEVKGKILRDVMVELTELPVEGTI